MSKNKVNDNEPASNEDSPKPKRGNPYEEVLIYDTSCNKIRKARNFRLASYEDYDDEGQVVVKKSVEFIVVGNNRTWKMYIPYDEFVKANPTVDIPGDNI